MRVVDWLYRAVHDGTNEEDSMAETETHAEHTVVEHHHEAGCGHEAVQHGDHVDFAHGDHKHAEHDGHYDEH